MIPQLEPTGFLPLGRYQCTLDELRQRYGWNEHRKQLLDDLDIYLAIWEANIPISRIWIGGSFLTSKKHPGDIDVTTIVRSRHINDASTRQFYSTMAQLLGGKFKDHSGLAIDQFLLLWHDYEDGPQNNQELDYCLHRGYWDDWWCRDRSTKSDQVRGYLEVNIHGNK